MSRTPKLQRVIDRLFKMEEINGAERCPTYLFRWTLARIGWLTVYLHHFIGDDWSRDCHNHPKRFISIGLFGSYCEETPSGKRVYNAPWIRSFPATHIHRLAMINGATCWTLVIVLRHVRPWGFWSERGWIPWRTYVNGDLAKKNCP